MDALQKIKDFMNTQDLSLRDLAKASGASHEMVGSWLRGLYRPTLERASVVADFMAAKGAFDSEEEKDAFLVAMLKLPRVRQVKLDTLKSRSQEASK